MVSGQEQLKTSIFYKKKILPIDAEVKLCAILYTV